MTFVLASLGTPGAPVHQLVGMETAKGRRTPFVKCGATLPSRSSDERGTDWTAWYSEVTCTLCREYCEV